MAGTLHLVATPIGNLGDLTARAAEVLRGVAFVVCEDTRHSGPWLRSLGVRAPLLSLPAFAEKERLGGIVARLEAGEDGALVTDAGSPGISDPGEALVAEAVARGIPVVPVPGPSAVIAALSASGLPSGRFHFLGFLPRSGPDRSAVLDEVAGLRATLVLYESARRLGETLAELARTLRTSPRSGGPRADQGARGVRPRAPSRARRALRRASRPWARWWCSSRGGERRCAGARPRCGRRSRQASPAASASSRCRRRLRGRPAGRAPRCTGSE